MKERETDKVKELMTQSPWFVGCTVNSCRIIRMGTIVPHLSFLSACSDMHTHWNKRGSAHCTNTHYADEVFQTCKLTSAHWRTKVQLSTTHIHTHTHVTMLTWQQEEEMVQSQCEDGDGSASVEQDGPPETSPQLQNRVVVSPCHTAVGKMQDR